MIIKSWACLNRYCLKVFDSSDGDYPPCPRCGGLKVKWVPRPVAIKSAATAQIDRDVQALKEVYGDKSYRTPRRGESVAPRANQAVGNRAQRYTPMAGWTADVPLDGNGNFMAHCAPTGVTSKVSAKVGQRVPVTSVAGKQLGVGGNIEASHRPPGGIPK